MNAKRYLVTSALPYANGPIHIGHVAGAYLPADIYVRYLRAKWSAVVFICGTDEYGTAITETARRQGRTPIEVADEFHVVIRDGFERLGISFDNFSRTSRQVHTEVTQEFFLKLHGKGLLRQVTTEQLFDPEVDKFLADRQIRGTCPYCGNEDAAGDQCEKCGKAIDPLELGGPRSALSGAGLERRATTHWYFPFEQFQPWLQEYLGSREGWRPQVLGFCQGYFTEGLRARPVTRDLEWGIPVPLPGHEGKVLYVWFDAPIGYISSTKEWAERIGQPDKWREYWCDQEGTKLVHFIGKDNTVFHALLFPAWCHAHGDYVIAEDVPANEFLNLEGQKFSTSRNHAVWLHDVLDRWPADVLRYYLTTILPETSDSDWKWADLRDRVNGELNDNLGNFAQRTLKFVASYHGARVPAAGELTDDDRNLLARTAALPGEVGGWIERYEFRQALRALLALGTEANGYFQRQQPWQLRRSDPARCGTVLSTCLQVCRAVSVCAAPFIPESAQKLWESLGEPGRVDQAGWDDAGTAVLPAGQATAGEPQPLFGKVTEEQVADEVSRLGGLVAAPAEVEVTVEQPVAEPEYINYEHF
ncbi:MAG: methionine--tRNA ligase, partial [Armatimonadetes bacterium]|nr:methionine--tRNA ligase [Armatimonadota bacterium]